MRVSHWFTWAPPPMRASLARISSAFTRARIVQASGIPFELVGEYLTEHARMDSRRSSPLVPARVRAPMQPNFHESP